MDKFGVILFNTNSSAMQAEAVLKKANVIVKMIPTPRELSSDCGISLRFDWTLKADVESLMIAMQVETAGIYPIPEGKYSS
jgi:hypothetical protein